MRTSHLAACGATPTRRSPGEAVDDAGITARVTTSIAHGAGIGEAAQGNVDTYRGTVSLAGFVDSPARLRRRAGSRRWRTTCRSSRGGELH